MDTLLKESQIRYCSQITSYSFYFTFSTVITTLSDETRTKIKWLLLYKNNISHSRVLWASNNRKHRYFVGPIYMQAFVPESFNTTTLSSRSLNDYNLLHQIHCIPQVSLIQHYYYIRFYIIGLRTQT